MTITRIVSTSSNTTTGPMLMTPHEGAWHAGQSTRLSVSQVLAEDVIFWHYEITNMTTTDYAKTLFAQYVDWGIGGMTTLPATLAITTNC